MNLRPRPALSLALATALGGTAATLPTPVAAETDEPMVQHCYTVALTDEEVAAGAVSEIDCFEVPADTPMELQSRSTVIWSTLYDIDNTTGDILIVSSPTSTTSCTGGSVVFGAGHSWDNRTSSTDLGVCGAAKHHKFSNFTGNNQLVNTSGLVYMNTTMNNDTSSIVYS